jgi:NDP-sugar pyrophosphorylase family protein
MRAVILAGGFGKRLYPYTVVLPKPLIPLGDQSIIEVVIRQLIYRGFDHITIAVGYHAELIMAILGDGSKFGIKIDYSMEEKPLNTIGPLRLIPNLDSPFLAMNGDLLTDLNFKDLFDYHIEKKSLLTVATCKRHVKISLGVIDYDENCHVTGFREKPEFDYDVSMGIYVFDPKIIDFIPVDEPFGFDQLVLKLLKEKQTVSVFPFEGKWLDMGTFDDLNLAIEEFEKNKDQYLLD